MRVKGHVKEGSRFGGMNLLGPGPRMILSAPAQRAGRGARGHAPFLEASRRSWRGGRAMNREERGVGTEGYKGEQDASLGLVVVVVPCVFFSSWWFLLLGRQVVCVVCGGDVCLFLVFGESGVRWSGSRHEGRGREAPLCQLCRASLRTREERARPPSHHKDAGNLQWSHGARSVIQAPRHKGLRTLSGALVSEGGLFFSFV